MNNFRNRFRPHLDSLETRDTPSNVTVSFANHILTIQGSTSSSIVIEGNASDATQFSLSDPSATNTFNGQPSYSSPTGVQNMRIALTGSSTNGDFFLAFVDTVRPIDLEGNLSVTVDSVDGRFIADDLTVAKSFTLTNTTKTRGNGDLTTLNFSNLNVGGNLTINSGDAYTQTEIWRFGSGVSTIGGNLDINNGSGDDLTSLEDLNVDGNVDIVNGLTDTDGFVGYIQIANVYNVGIRSVIKGNLSVSYAGGPGMTEPMLVQDLEVEGSATFSYGSGLKVETDFDGYKSSLPDVIGGNLTIEGPGVSTVKVGTTNQQTGMMVEKNLILTNPATGTVGDTLDFNRLQVFGLTKLNLDQGNNNVTIDQSIFGGAFALTAGNGINAFDLEMTAGDTTPSEFDSPVVVSLGGGKENVSDIGGANKMIALSTFEVKGWHYIFNGIGMEIFPFGGGIDLEQ
jgi:hypothetical protein